MCWLRISRLIKQIDQMCLCVFLCICMCVCACVWSGHISCITCLDFCFLSSSSLSSPAPRQPSSSATSTFVLRSVGSRVFTAVLFDIFFQHASLKVPVNLRHKAVGRHTVLILYCWCTDISGLKKPAKTAFFSAGSSQRLWPMFDTVFASHVLQEDYTILL